MVERQYRSGGRRALRLFFPFSNPYTIIEFASYLNYRGIPVEGAEGEARNINSVVLATKAVTKDGPCEEWMRIRCLPATEPAPGDLVIVLPDDRASLADASVYRERGELLFFYEPRPPIPNWLHAVFDGLHIGTTRLRLRHQTNPDRWMDGSVTTWK